jgi:uncharacterized RDD family membrane protein YckC
VLCDKRVDVHGRRQTIGVSLAAGGSFEPIVTGEAVAVELRTAGIGSRGIAVLIDFAIQGALIVTLAFVAAATEAGVNSAAGAALFVTLYVAVLLGYPVGFETLWRGRTPGKAVMGLRVARDDGGPIRFRHAFVRGLVGVVVDRPGVSLGLLALVPMLASARSKRMGDLAAGTVVLQERVPARVTPPPVMPTPLTSWATTLDLSRVTDDVALQVRHFLARAGELAPWARNDLGSRLMSDVVHRTGATPPAGVPPWAYLSAVLAERRRRELARSSPAVAADPHTPVADVPPSSEPPPAGDLPPAQDGPFAPPA